MAEKIKLSYVLPTLNEVENLSIFFSEIRKLGKTNNIEFIFVDDNSTDGTFEYLCNQKNKFNNIRLLKRLENKGLSHSIKAGFLISKGEYVVVMDTDGQHEIKTTTKLYNQIHKEKFDLVIASRFLKDSQIENFPIMRLYFSKFGNLISRLSLPKEYSFLTDYMSGCFILRKRSCYKYIKEMETIGFKFLYNLLNQSKGYLNVCELPHIFKKRQYGKSKLNFYNLFVYLFSVINKFFFICIKSMKVNLSKIFEKYQNKKKYF